MSGKKNFTFSLNPEIHQQFKIRTLIDEIEMSDVIENMMDNYVKMSIKLNDERKEEKNRE